MTAITDKLKAAAVPVGGLIGAAIAQAPWPALLLVGLVGVVLWFAWQVFQRPDLAREWMEIRWDFKRGVDRDREAVAEPCSARELTAEEHAADLADVPANAGGPLSEASPSAPAPSPAARH